jgi:hypothetical protein
MSMERSIHPGNAAFDEAEMTRGDFGIKRKIELAPVSFLPSVP